MLSMVGRALDVKGSTCYMHDDVRWVGSRASALLPAHLAYKREVLVVCCSAPGRTAETALVQQRRCLPCKI